MGRELLELGVEALGVALVALAAGWLALEALDRAIGRLRRRGARS